MPVPLFRIFYSTVFTILSILLVLLIILTPADAIYQCYKNDQLVSIFVIAGAYVVTLLLAGLIYASRIYTNRSTLAGIPKAWIPVEKADVGKSVRRLVVEGLARSAIIAYQARPRDVSGEDGEHEGRGDGEEERTTPQQQAGLTISNPDRPPWGDISHPGWSPPSSSDLPDLEYESVIEELPNLIEAKAVSLAPVDPLLTPPIRTNERHDPHSPSHNEYQPLPDARVVDVLKRPITMSFRDYISHLSSLGLINPPQLGGRFLAIYEHARFSSHPLTENEFRSLMGTFAEILRGMTALDPSLVADIQDSDLRGNRSFTGSFEEGDFDTLYSQERDSDVHSQSSDSHHSNASVTGSVQRSTHTAPMSHRTVGTAWTGDHPGMGPRTPSMNSLRRVRSNMSRSSDNSVIRLTEARSPLDLPYTIDIPGRRNR
ncbi:hypothetical protein FQN54_005792 [Arachnomyces sp. PD_36]|nr:hypothetical protein FQN54_005792 [Arachnomyces sp. PD_36]